MKQNQPSLFRRAIGRLADVSRCEYGRGMYNQSFRDVLKAVACVSLAVVAVGAFLNNRWIIATGPALWLFAYCAYRIMKYRRVR
jgi:hypothetical protein